MKRKQLNEKEYAPINAEFREEKRNEKEKIKNDD